MILKIISTERILFDGPVDRVLLPGSCGPFAVLERHAPLISALIPGEIIYTVGGKENRLVVEGGIVEIRENWVSVCLN